MSSPSVLFALACMIFADEQHHARPQVAEGTCQVLLEAVQREATPEVASDELAFEIAGLAWMEGGFYPDLVSPHGAIGPLQILPRFGKKFLREGESLQSVEVQARVGVRMYLFWRRACGTGKPAVECYVNGYRRDREDQARKALHASRRIETIFDRLMDGVAEFDLAYERIPKLPEPPVHPRDLKEIPTESIP